MGKIKDKAQDLKLNKSDDTSRLLLHHIVLITVFQQ